ncbi:MAG: V4R domain-containing protein [Longimicrobiales bacterium]
MGNSAGTSREIAIPASVFESLRAEVASAAGTLQTVRALHHAGYYAGVEAAVAMNQETGGDAFALSETGFWSSLSNFFSKRGWGTLSHSAPHSAIGILHTRDWAEARPAANDREATCSFSTGYLSGLLSQLAGAPVAVLEVSCRSRGGHACEFAFGSETAVHDLYGKLLDGADMASALDAL